MYFLLLGLLAWSPTPGGDRDNQVPSGTGGGSHAAALLSSCLNRLAVLKACTIMAKKIDLARILLASCLGLAAATGQAAILEKLRQGKSLMISAIGTSETAMSPWSGQMAAWLNAQYPDKITIDNEAISGTTSRNGISSQLPAALTHNPDAVFIEFAINDVGAIPLQESKDNLQTMINTVSAWAAGQHKSVDIVIQTTNNDPFNEFRRDLASYYQGYRDVAASNGLLLIDNYPDWCNLYDTDPATWHNYMMADNIHPNALGVENVILPNIQRALTSQVPEPNVFVLLLTASIFLLGYTVWMLSAVPRRLCRKVAVLLLAAVAVVAPPQAKGWTDPRVSWMASGSFGVMTHFLPTPTGDTDAEKTADLNRLVNQFDVDGYIQQFQATGADWLIFTLGQKTGYLNSPNPAIDNVLPGHTPQRDLALEIAQRVHSLGKRMILYYPSGGDADWAVAEALGYGAAEYDDRYFDFIRQYSVKFGNLCDGWWFDACSGHTGDFWSRWQSAVRAGNSNSAVAFSTSEFQGGSSPITPICTTEDYLAGEIHLLEDGLIRRDLLWPPESVYATSDGKLRIAGQTPIFYLPHGPTIDGVQWHGLLALDQTFNTAIPNEYCQYTDQQLISFVSHIKSVGGALTINVPIDEFGHILPGSEAKLVQLGASLGVAVPEPSMLVLLTQAFVVLLALALVGLLGRHSWKQS